MNEDILIVDTPLGEQGLVPVETESPTVAYPVAKPEKKKRGRPRKTDIEAAKKPGKVGRPPGDAARMAEFKARLMATSGDKVIAKIIEVALTDGHPAQGAMLKFTGERLLPLSSFEKESGTGKSSINITITGVGGATTVEAAQTVDATDVDYLDDVQ